MTGEMSWINQDGEDSHGETWSTHAAIAKAVGGELRPFDVYQGPYIAVADTRLWLCAEGDGMGFIYREDINATSETFPMEWEEDAIALAHDLLAR